MTFRGGFRKASEFSRSLASESSPSTSYIISHPVLGDIAGQSAELTAVDTDDHDDYRRNVYSDSEGTTEKNVSLSYEENETKEVVHFTGFKKASQLIGSSASTSQSRNITARGTKDNSLLSQRHVTKTCVNPVVEASHNVEEGDNYSGKKRRILMNTNQCFEYQKTEEGLKALVNPFSLKTSRNNINKYLQPRAGGGKRKKRNHQIENQSSIRQFFQVTSFTTKQRAAKQELTSPQKSSQISLPVSDNKPLPSNDRATFKKKTINVEPNNKTRKRKRPPTQCQPVDEVVISSDSDEGNFVSACNFSAKHYGLFGDSCDDILETVSFFERLPVELKSMIFCHLSAYDLFYTCPRVCSDWNNLIIKNKFMPWKLKYHLVRKDIGSHKTQLLSDMQKNGFTDFTDNLYLPHLVRHMKRQYSCGFHDLLPSLAQHPCYQNALSLMETEFKDCITNKNPNGWCMVVLLCIMSSTVNECQQLVKALLSSPSYSSPAVLLDGLYCIITHLYGMKSFSSNKPWNVMHYRLYYALYLTEHCSAVTVAEINKPRTQGQTQQPILRYCDSKNKLHLTNEQLQIVNHNVQPGEVVKIVAFAGTGKSSTLLRYTQMRPGLKFLLVVYNKSVCEHSRSVFPPNVHCVTGHGLAFKNKGIRYKLNQKLLFGSIKVRHLEMALPARPGHGSHTLRARLVLTILEKFLNSKDSKISREHLNDFMNSPIYMEKFAGKVDPEACLKDTQQYWSQMIDFDDENVKISHDGYLKLFQLSKPQLTQYDIILIDEAQDITPAIADIFLSLPQAKILVGDPNQQIYAFKGAVNAMQSIEATHTFYLTQSFRFGPQIAFVANCILEKSYKPTEILVGGSKKSSIRGETIGQLAYISRCNSTLFIEAVRTTYNQQPRPRLAFVGKTSGFGFDVLRDIHTLLIGGSSRALSQRNSFISRFKSFYALKKYAENTLDYELLGKIQIAQTYSLNLPVLLEYFENAEILESRDADIVFTTAHKSKGLEFDTVKVLSDFSLETQDEKNLFYVAVTRAKRSLYLTNDLLELLHQFGDPTMRIESSTVLKKAGKPILCSVCGLLQEEKEKTSSAKLYVYKETIKTVNITINGGILCKGCTLNTEPSLCFIYGTSDD